MLHSYTSAFSLFGDYPDAAGPTVQAAFQRVKRRWYQVVVGTTETVVPVPRSPKRHPDIR